jgi:putative sterol carrier protein
MSNIVERFADLRKLADDTPRENLFTALEARPGGVDAMLDHIFGEMCAGFDPARSRGETGTFEFAVSAPDGVHNRFITVDNGAVVTADSTVEPNVTMALDLADFVDLATGTLPGPQAFMSGKLTLTGDMFFAMNWGEWFGGE